MISNIIKKAIIFIQVLMVCVIAYGSSTVYADSSENYYYDYETKQYIHDNQEIKKSVSKATMKNLRYITFHYANARDYITSDTVKIVDKLVSTAKQKKKGTYTIYIDLSDEGNEETNYAILAYLKYQYLDYIGMCNCKGEIINSGDSLIRRMTFDLEDLNDHLTKQVEMEKWYDSLIRQLNISTKTTQYEAIKRVYDWMTDNLIYDMDYKMSDYNIVKYKRGVCCNYAATFNNIMHRIGIESTSVSCFEINHVWNKVQVDGKWYYIDITWDQGIADKYKNDFLVSEESIRRSHRPASGSYTYNEYELYKLQIKKIYSIKYMNLSGCINDNPKQIIQNQSLVLKSPQRQDYVFEGWYTDKNYKNRVKSLTKVQKNIILYAKWGRKQCSIEYKNIKKTDINNNKTTVSYNEVYKLRSPTRKGYRFAGWYTDTTYKSKVSSIKATGNMKLYARWIKK